MIGEIRYWAGGDAYGVVLGASDAVVVVAWWGGEGKPLGVTHGEPRFWERHKLVAA